MKRIPLKEIENYLSLYRRLGSLRAVSKKTGRSVNTIKKYLLGKTPLNLRITIKNANISDDTVVGTYVGLWMGDGTQYHDGSYVVKFCSNKKQKELNLLIQDVIIKIFNKKSWLIEDCKTNRAYIKLRSKFIYDFINKYCYFDNNKTLTVCLKENIENLSENFIDGVLLGLALSDGYLKKRFYFSSISDELSKNVYDILLKRGFSPNKYTHDRSRFKWHDLHQIYLSVGESQDLLRNFDSTIQRLESNKTFTELKYGPAEI